LAPSILFGYKKKQKNGLNLFCHKDSREKIADYLIPNRGHSPLLPCCRQGLGHVREGSLGIG
jgi:hypothetical protein